MVFIDVHCHVDRCENIEATIKRAAKANVGIIVNNGINPETNRKTIELAKKHKEIKTAMGIYPVDGEEMDEKEFNSELEFIKKNAHIISAIGEVGLDLKIGKNLERQKQNLAKFIELSKELKIPIIIHSRKAEKECIELLEKFDVKQVIMHCFSGNFNLVKRIMENGWTFSIPANITFSEHFQKVADLVPISQLLCETDSPYLHPRKERNNEPANVVESYKKIAEIKGLSLSETEQKLESNYNRLFSKK
ncbi:MAG TPA: TatD family hydrolase [Candidatus Nanoarchaeia archaeon]|nr:TatD family hydrolase [Candidatus Nanoarchaeia archaeon]